VHSAHEPVKRDRLVRLPEVERIAGIRKSTIYTLMAKNPPEFPRCVQVTSRCVAWSEAACLSWVQQRIEATERNADAGGTGAGK